EQQHRKTQTETMDMLNLSAIALAKQSADGSRGGTPASGGRPAQKRRRMLEKLAEADAAKARRKSSNSGSSSRGPVEADSTPTPPAVDRWLGLRSLLSG
ncbi:unnamed protein product, partial [Polarella glacialis]